MMAIIYGISVFVSSVLHVGLMFETGYERINVIVWNTGTKGGTTLGGSWHRETSGSKRQCGQCLVENGGDKRVTGGLMEILYKQV